MENMLILHIEDRVYGTIVDKIDKVVSIASDSIQPPHPIFGDINIKYIHGVVEKQGDLYIILDVVRIFSQKGLKDDGTHADVASAAIMSPAGIGVNAGAGSGAGVNAGAGGVADAGAAKLPISDVNLGFIKDGLAALKKFYPGPLNEDWIRARLREWSLEHSASDIQFKNADDAGKFLESFPSKCSAVLWSDDYASRIKAHLGDLSSNALQVWNPGCGKGYESFSFACLLKTRYPDARIKIWANDSDIMAIANAPNPTFDLDDVPEYVKPFLIKGRAGYGFNQIIKDAIVFEYHDVTNANTLPDIDIVFIRDTLSYLNDEARQKVLDDIGEKLKSKGLVIIGDNEKLGPQWQAVGKDGISAYVKA
jgi:purine-binding chemotaxis protein CheW